MTQRQPAAGAEAPRGLRQALSIIYQQMSPARKRHFYLVMALLLLGALAELLALAAALPFLSVITEPASIHEMGFTQSLFRALGVTSQSGFVIAAAVMFALAALAAGLLRLVLTWYSQTFVFQLGHEIGVNIHRLMLYQSYSYHIAHNSSEMVAALEKVQTLVWSVLQPMMTAWTSAILSIFIIVVLVYADPVIAAAAAGSFCVIYLLVSSFTRGRLSRNSEVINASYAKRVQSIQESLGGIRDIIIDQSQPVYVQQFREADKRFRRAQTINSFIGSAPRFVIEAAGMALIALLAVLMSQRDGGLTAGLPVLGILVLGAQRLLPLLQQVYYGWAQIRGSRAIVFDVVKLIDLPEPEPYTPSANPPNFSLEIALDDVGFTYAGRVEPALSGVALTISKGSWVALIGQTGSGKSTLVDLLMGLLEPTSGSIRVDGVQLIGSARIEWQRQIAHVPQTIFLADATIADNIALGVPRDEIDLARVETAARRAQLHDFITALPEGYATEVGESGVRLSGGQRQRLGIARALYKQAAVLVLDEATSALDDDTEKAVMASLHGLAERLTVIMIAHRLSTVAGCDQVVRLSGGRVAELGSYREVVKPDSASRADATVDGSRS